VVGGGGADRGGPGAAARDGHPPCPPAPIAELSPPAGDPGWEPVTETAGIRIFSRAVAGASIKEVLARTVLAVPPARVYAVLSDLEHYAEFMPYVSAAQVLRTEGERRWLFKQLSFPLVSERHTVVVVTGTASAGPGGQYQVQWRRAPPGGITRRGDGIEIPVNEGHWHLEPRCRGTHTDVTYYVRTDPGGVLPAFVVNLANRRAVPAVIEALAARAAVSGARGASR